MYARHRFMCRRSHSVNGKNLSARSLTAEAPPRTASARSHSVTFFRYWGGHSVIDDAGSVDGAAPPLLKFTTMVRLLRSGAKKPAAAGAGRAGWLGAIYSDGGCVAFTGEPAAAAIASAFAMPS